MTPANASADFEGFPQSGLRLLDQLKKHNDRDWFNEHKQQYFEQVEAPMEALVTAVAAGSRARGLPLYTKDKNPVMRVYRDVRFSKDKTPYKTHVAADLRSSFSRSHALLYVHISPTESFTGAGVWQAERPFLLAWREALVEDFKRFEAMVAALGKQGLSLSQEHALSSMPRGFTQYADAPVGPWLKLTSFVAIRPIEPSQLLEPGLVNHVVEFAVAAKPLFEFIWKVEEALPPPDK